MVFGFSRKERLSSFLDQALQRGDTSVDVHLRIETDLIDLLGILSGEMVYTTKPSNNSYTDNLSVGGAELNQRLRADLELAESKLALGVGTVSLPDGQSKTYKN